jgi:hypothetical protein
MMPPVAVVAGVTLSVALSRHHRARLLAPLCAGVLALSASAGLQSDPEVVGPQEHPGMLGVRDFLRGHPGASFYYHYKRVIDFYLPEGRCEGERAGRWTPETIESVKRGHYDFVVTDLSLFDPPCPGIACLSTALAPDYALVHAVRHRRTGEPVAWVFAASPVSHD